MVASSIVTTVLALAGTALLVVASVRAWRVWRRYRAEWIVTCPATGQPAAVRVATARAALSGLVDQSPTLTLQACSCWPERGICDGPCVPQIESNVAPAVPDVAAGWYAGKSCVYCHRSIPGGPNGISRAALRGPDGVTTEWRGVSGDRLLVLFRTHLPVCWDCHVAETFRRLYPELVVDRPAH